MSDVIFYCNVHEIQNTYRIWEELLSEKYSFADYSYRGEWTVLGGQLVSQRECQTVIPFSLWTAPGFSIHWPLGYTNWEQITECRSVNMSHQLLPYWQVQEPGIVQQQKKQQVKQHQLSCMDSIIKFEAPNFQGVGGATKKLLVGDTTRAYCQTIYRWTALYL